MFEIALVSLAESLANPSTRDAYMRGALEFERWCTSRGLSDPTEIRQVDLSAYAKDLRTRLGHSAVKQRLAGIRALLRQAGLDAIATGQMATPPTPPPRIKDSSEQVRRLLEHTASHCSATRMELRDRALIHFLARIPMDVTAVVRLRTGDVILPASGREDLDAFGTFRSRDAVKGSEGDLMLPKDLQGYLTEYIAATDLAVEEQGWLFRTMRRQSDRVSMFPMTRVDAWRIVRKRSGHAGLSVAVTPRDLNQFAGMGDAAT